MIKDYIHTIRITPKELLLALIAGLYAFFLVLFPYKVNNHDIIQPLINGPFFYFVAWTLPLVLFSHISKAINTPLFVIRKLDLLVILFISYLIANKAISKGFYIDKGQIEWLCLLLLYFAIRLLNKSNYQFLLYALLLSALTQAIYGQLQLYGIYSTHHSHFGITGSFFNPAPYAGYLAGIFPIALLLYYNTLHTPKNESTPQYIYHKSAHYYALLVMVAIIIVMPATQSRAAWMSCLLLSSYIVSIKSHSFSSKLVRIKEKYANRYGLVALIVIITLMLLFFLYWIKKDSADGRLLIWKIALSMLSDKPLWGFSAQGFEAFYMNFQASFFLNHPDHSGILLADNVQYAYNEILKVLIEYGIVGGALFILLLIEIYYTKLRAWECHAAKCGLIGLLIFGLFSYPSHIIQIKVYAVILLAIVASYSSSIKSYKPAYPKITLIISLLLVSTLGVFSYSRVMNYYDALCAWNDASDIYNIEAYEESIDDFEIAYPILRHNGDFLVQYGKALTMANKHPEAIIILERAKNYLNNIILYTALGDAYNQTNDYQKAEECYQTAYYMAPSRFYPLYLLAKMYKKSEQESKAINTAQDILSKEIKVPSSAIDEIREYAQEIVSEQKSK